MRLPISIICMCFVLGANAQSRELIVGGVTGSLHLEHTVTAKENWYSVGRLYNVNPKTLAQYNHQGLGHPLDIGQVLTIPLSSSNFSQDGKKLPSESLLPVYHIVQEKEWLYRISVNHDKVPIPTLEKWNHVTGDQVHPGLHLIVGYLKVKTALSALAKEGTEPRLAEEGTEPARVAKALMPPPVKAAAGDSGGTKAEVADNGGAETARVTGRAPVKAPAVDPATAGAPARGLDPGTATAVPSAPRPAPHFDGGRFKDDFNDGGHSATGQAGVFKSTSGWQDGKYYALINNVPVGTIVKITDQANGKSVYAKVLGQLPEMKESAGLTVRLSNAAAAELGEAEGKFGVGVHY